MNLVRKRENMYLHVFVCIKLIILDNMNQFLGTKTRDLHVIYMKQVTEIIHI